MCKTTHVTSQGLGSQNLTFVLDEGGTEEGLDHVRGGKKFPERKESERGNLSRFGQGLVGMH